MDVGVNNSSEFIKILKNINSPDYSIRYCFILGAGASKSSGIPTGEELASRWYNEIKDIFDHYEIWKQEKGINEDNLAKDYGEIYRKRFELNFEEGYQYLENLMLGSEPSFGYSILAHILSSTKHNIVITTNFDSLTEDALFIYSTSRQKPLVCGHEFLSQFVNLNTRRPVVLKLHRDLFFGPKNLTNETSDLPAPFHNLLQQIFKIYTPVFIGYAGNDGSLMNCLKQSDIKQGSKWCVISNNNPNPEINNLLNDKKGGFVKIQGFDEFMLEIAMAVLPDLNPDKNIEESTKNRVANWSSQFVNLASKLSCYNKSFAKNIKAIIPEKPVTIRDYLLQIIYAEEKEKRKILEIAKEKFSDQDDLDEIDEFFAQHLRDLDANKNEIIKIESQADNISIKVVSDFYSIISQKIKSNALPIKVLQSVDLKTDNLLSKDFDIAVESEKYIYLFTIRYTKHRRSVQRIANRINELSTQDIGNNIFKNFSLPAKPILPILVLPIDADPGRIGSTIYNIPILKFDLEEKNFNYSKSFDITTYEG